MNAGRSVRIPACATRAGPVLPMVDPRTGNVHVVNDTRVTITNAEVEVAVDGRARRWQGTVDADTIAFIGRMELDDAIDVEVMLTHPAVGRVVNRYPLLILEAGRAELPMTHL